MSCGTRVCRISFQQRQTQFVRRFGIKPQVNNDRRISFLLMTWKRCNIVTHCDNQYRACAISSTSIHPEIASFYQFLTVLCSCFYGLGFIVHRRLYDDSYLSQKYRKLSISKLSTQLATLFQVPYQKMVIEIVITKDTRTSQKNELLSVV